jgi:hypothetical protein
MHQPGAQLGLPFAQIFKDRSNIKVEFLCQTLSRLSDLIDDWIFIHDVMSPYEGSQKDDSPGLGGESRASAGELPSLGRKGETMRLRREAMCNIAKILLDAESDSMYDINKTIEHGHSWFVNGKMVNSRVWPCPVKHKSSSSDQR